jgi:hypothetical protein
MLVSAFDTENPMVPERTPLDGRDVVLMELHLRDLADVIAEQLGEALLNELRAVAIAEAATRLYRSWSTRSLARLDEANNVALATINDTRYVFPSGRYIENVSNEELGFDGATLAALVTALVWADELAGDYVDPGVPKNFLAVSPER